MSASSPFHGRWLAWKTLLAVLRNPSPDAGSPVELEVGSFQFSVPGRWAATLLVLIGVPGVSHAVDFCLHWLRGTPNLRTSILASLALTLISSSFNLHAMRRGVLVVGSGEQSLASDMRLLPRTIWSFMTSGFGFGALKTAD